MTFAQLTYRESLCDLEDCLRAMWSKLFHMGIHSMVSRNNLANANEKATFILDLPIGLQINRGESKLFAGFW